MSNFKKSFFENRKKVVSQAVAEYLLIFAIVAAVSLLGVAVFYDKSHQAAEQFYLKTAAAIAGNPASSSVDFDEPEGFKCSEVPFHPEGLVYFDVEYNTWFCKFSGNICPAGWEQLDKWSTTKSRDYTCSCGDDCCSTPGPTGEHPFSNKGIECAGLRTSEIGQGDLVCEALFLDGRCDPNLFTYRYCAEKSLLGCWAGCAGEYCGSIYCQTAEVTEVGCVPIN